MGGGEGGYGLSNWRGLVSYLVSGVYGVRTVTTLTPFASTYVQARIVFRHVVMVLGWDAGSGSRFRVQVWQNGLRAADLGFQKPSTQKPPQLQPRGASAQP